MSRQFKPLQTIFDAKAAIGTGAAILVEDFKTATLQIGTASSGSLTMKIQTSDSDTCPNFATAQSVANHWDYVQCVDLEDGSTVDGDTGFVVAGADDFKRYEVNMNGAKWLCATVTARAAGRVTLKVKLFND